MGTTLYRMTFKIFIIGGGPAGLSAAIWSSKCGFDTTLIESNRFPGIKPGEALHPGMERVFEMLNIKDEIDSLDIIRNDGYWHKWDGLIHHVTFGQNPNHKWLGYQLPRRDLENILRERAIREGVNVIDNCYAIDLIVKNGSISSIFATKGNFECDFVIDASGRYNWLARKLQYVHQRVTPQLFAYYGYSKENRAKFSNFPLFFSTPSGWMWISKIGEDVFQWTTMNLHNMHFQEKIPKRFLNSQTLQSTRSIDVTWIYSSIMAKSNHILIGDAAFSLDPASSHGIMKGMISGIKALDYLKRALKGIISFSTLIIEYNNFMKQWFRYDCSNLSSLYKSHPNPPAWVLSSAF